MTRPNLEAVVAKVEKKYQKKDQRAKIKMKVSGASVKHLQRIIKHK